MAQKWDSTPPKAMRLMISDCSGQFGSFLGSPLHLDLASQNRTPVFVLGYGHAALDTDADARLWRLVLAQQSFQK